jgi:hypothetical protein
MVLLAGEVAYVAAWGFGEGRGGVTVWRRGATGAWTQDTTLTAGDAAPNDFFGSSLAADGNRLLVGAAQKDSAMGAAYLFLRDPATGRWTQEARLRGRGIARNSAFGSAAALRGNEVLIGAPGLDRGLGGAFLFARDSTAGEWQERARLSAFDAVPSGQFGATVAYAENELWIGAPGADAGHGQIYRLRRAADGSFTEALKTGHPDLERGDRFGSALAISGSTAVVGLTGDDFGAGTVVAFSRGPAGWTAGPKFWNETAGLTPIVGGKRECIGSRVEAFECGGVDLLSFLPVKGAGRGPWGDDQWELGMDRSPDGPGVRTHRPHGPDHFRRRHRTSASRGGRLPSAARRRLPFGLA